jgi:hypothetical protein
VLREAKRKLKPLLTRARNARTAEPRA